MTAEMIGPSIIKPPRFGKEEGTASRFLFFTYTESRENRVPAGKSPGNGPRRKGLKKMRAMRVKG